MDNIGGFYYLNSADIRIGSDASIKNITCNNVASNTEKSDVSGAAENVWKNGDKVMVEENGVWYPSVILDTKPGDQYYICLLYTSPSPRDRTRSRMPSSA